MYTTKHGANDTCSICTWWKKSSSEDPDGMETLGMASPPSLWLPKSLWCLASKWWIYLCFLQNWVVFTHLWRMLDMYGYVANSQLIPNSCWLNPNPNSAGHGAWIQQHGRPRLVWSSSSPWLNARLWPQILRSFVLQDSIDWFRCENLSRKPYKHIITSYVYIYSIYVYQIISYW